MENKLPGETKNAHLKILFTKIYIILVNTTVVFTLFYMQTKKF